MTEQEEKLRIEIEEALDDPRSTLPFGRENAMKGTHPDICCGVYTARQP